MENIIYLLLDAIELGLIWGLLSLGIYISFRVLDFPDLTSEGSFTLGAAICASLIQHNVNPFIALIIGALNGVLAGIVTGIIHIKFKIPGLLAGIIAMTGLYSINLRIMGVANLSLIGQNTVFKTFYNELLTNQMTRIVVALTIVIIVLMIIYWFFGTEIGISLRATGMNQHMARAEGINTGIMIISGLAISNALVGLGGGLLAQSQGFADVGMGRGVIVIGLASIIIGEVLFGKRSFKNCIISTILGTIIYHILIGVALKIGFNPNDLKLLSAILIVIILVTPLIKSNLRKLGLKGGVTNVKNN